MLGAGQLMQLPKRLEDGTPYLSHSQVKELLTCPARYRFKYIEGRKEPIGVDAFVGFAVHDALEAAFNRSKESQPSGDVAADARRRFTEQTTGNKHISVPAGTDMDALADEAGMLSDLGLQEVLGRGLTPVEAEATVVRPMGDYALFGRLDLLARDRQGRLVLVDLKTAKRSPSGERANRAHALQTLNYVPAVEQDHGEAVSEVQILYLVRTKTPKAVWCEVPLTDQSRAWATHVLESAARQVRSGDLPPNPIGAGFMCDPRFCGFWNICPGAPRHEEAEA